VGSVDRLRGLIASRGIAWEPVAGITSLLIRTTKDAKLVLAKSGASVLDMSSPSGVPAAVLRVVSDSLEIPRHPNTS
jgi:hypothetical protein